MSNVIGFATARKTARGELVAGWLDGGEVRIYDGTRPANADTAIGSQVRLATLEMADPAGTVTNGVFTAAAMADALIAETGTAAWARVVDSTAATIFDVDVGGVGSGAFIELDNLSLIEGAYCTVVSFLFTER